MGRGLVAVFFADVVGYCRLMGMSEPDTFATLKELRSQLFDPTIAAHKGRLVTPTGDGVLAEFASVLNAVNCAVQIQQEMMERNAAVPDDRRMVFRIGINIVDAIRDDEGIHGDGVNVAARLESIAEPGGICVSRAVRDQMRGKSSYEFRRPW